jgi:tRNA threonylcarbamoyladenosine biosynthesis protein TsaE
MKQELQITTEQQTIDLAATIAAKVTQGDVIALYGELGAGKTFFTQALCRALGVQEYVSSPSYILLNEYQAAFPIAHFDLYRLSSAEEALELGIPEIFEQCLTIIEWPGVAQELLPPDALHLYFELADDDVRQVTIEWGKQ